MDLSTHGCSASQTRQIGSLGPTCTDLGVGRISAARRHTTHWLESLLQIPTLGHIDVNLAQVGAIGVVAPCWTYSGMPEATERLPTIRPCVRCFAPSHMDPARKILLPSSEPRNGISLKLGHRRGNPFVGFVR